MTQTLQEQYATRWDSVLVPLAKELEIHIADLFKDVARIDRIVVRAKSVDRFVGKAEKKDANGRAKYSDPLTQIQDQIGARIVTFYCSDISRISLIAEKYFNHIEYRDIIPESDSEFGYVGKHYIFFIPSEVLRPTYPESHVPKFFELQIKTLFQHSWAEANHDLGYKPESPLSKEQKRRLAFTAAQAWGADMIFDLLFSEASRPS